MSARPFRRAASGLSLIEILIALAIGSLLILGLVQVFAASRTAYQLSEGMARAQENARFAMDYLQRDIRMAGHFGCVNDQSHLLNGDALTNHFNAAASGTWGIDFPVSVRGYDATGTAPGSTVSLAEPDGGWAPLLPDAISDLEPLPGSDIIELRFLANEGVPVETIANPGPTQMVFTVDGLRGDTFTDNGVGTPEMFGIADCSYVDVFPATLAGTTTVTATVKAPITRYTPQPAGQTMLYRAESLVYYVGTSPTTEGPALFRARSNGNGVYGPAEELVEGIENLQFMYALDREESLDDTPPTGYIEDSETASSLTNSAEEWRRVGIVQVGMLATSPNPAAAVEPDDDRNPVALGVTLDPPADTRFRASYEATIALRNRLYGN